MSQPDALTAILQAQLAPVLHDTAAALTAALERRAGPEELAALPNIGLLLRALEGSRVAGDRVALDFGAANQFGDVTIGDVALGTMLKLHLHLHQSDPLIDRVAPVAAGGPPLEPVGVGNRNAPSSEAPAGSAAPPRPPRVLVCDGLTRSAAGEALRLVLRLRGVESPDLPPLSSYTIAELARLLADADAAVVILSPAVCATRTLHAVELPALWARYGRPAPFLLLPVIEGASDAALSAANAAFSAAGASLDDFRAVQIPETPGDEQAGALGALAGLLLEQVGSAPLRCAAATRKSIALTVFSYPVSGARPPADLALSWEALFPESDQPTRPHPTPEIWRSLLDPALADLRRVVGAAQAEAESLRISGRYHIPVGLALGFRFRAVAGTPLLVSAQPGGFWRSDESGGAGELLQVTPVELDPPLGGDLSVEVSVSRDVRPAAERYLREYRIPVARRIQLTCAPLLQDTPDIVGAQRFVSSPAHAAALAAQIANVILHHGAGTIHLFAAIPQALAVLIGARLNKARPVQCYDLYDDPERGRSYVPACLLR